MNDARHQAFPSLCRSRVGCGATLAGAALPGGRLDGVRTHPCWLFLTRSEPARSTMVILPISRLKVASPSMSAAPRGRLATFRKHKLELSVCERASAWAVVYVHRGVSVHCQRCSLTAVFPSHG
jgi:hypothetical protein